MAAVMDLAVGLMVAPGARKKLSQANFAAKKAGEIPPFYHHCFFGKFARQTRR